MKNEKIQLVTFQLGTASYGIDIQYIKEVHNIERVQSLPNTPKYIEGILTLRNQIIPIINLHIRFNITPPIMSPDETLLRGFIIVKIEQGFIGFRIDKILRVVQFDKNSIQVPPQMMSGINGEYIQGLIIEDGNYLILLDIIALFSRDEFIKYMKI